MENVAMLLAKTWPWLKHGFEPAYLHATPSAGVNGQKW